jgi:hypothetical protein
LEELDIKDPVTMKSVPADAKTMGEVMFRAGSHFTQNALENNLKFQRNHNHLVSKKKPKLDSLHCGNFLHPSEP